MEYEQLIIMALGLIVVVVPTGIFLKFKNKLSQIIDILETIQASLKDDDTISGAELKVIIRKIKVLLNKNG